MILVLADDFTGAAEIAGIALRYNLSVEIQHKRVLPTAKELLVVDTDSRSISVNKATARILEIIGMLPKDRIDWVYKKTDSVLRGHVVVELEHILNKMNKKAALLIPSNPSLGRTITNGVYYADGIPLHQTQFVHDPEYPATTSAPLKMLGKSNLFKTHLLKAKDSIPAHGISIAEIVTTNDLLLRTMQLTNKIIPAGGSDFFDAILKVRSYVSHECTDQFSMERENVLIVCGSASEVSRKFVSSAKEKGIYISQMPETLFNASDIQPNLIKSWAADISSIFSQQLKVIVTIDRPVVRKTGISKRLREIIAATVAGVLERVPVKELFIEGGATVAAIIQRLGWQVFYPLQEFGLGIVRMQVAENPKLKLTIKPGSYLWNEGIVM